jgi:competence protein ComFB
MDLHNTVEDIVIARVDEIFKALDEKGDKKFCTCNQCKLDVICYALNRLRPHYIVSHKGASRARRDSFEHQQQAADVAAIIHEGLQRVNHNQRPNFSHKTAEDGLDPDGRYPVFNIPTIMGRIFNGNDFSPVSGVDVELIWNGKLVSMKDGNWHNPCHMVSNAEGTFSFWPTAVRASKLDEHSVISYTLRVTSPEFEPLSHFFKIPVISETQTAASFSLDRTYKLPDLYMFYPGEAEKNENQN